MLTIFVFRHQCVDINVQQHELNNIDSVKRISFLSIYSHKKDDKIYQEFSKVFSFPLVRNRAL